VAGAGCLAHGHVGRRRPRRLAEGLRDGRVRTRQPGRRPQPPARQPARRLRCALGPVALAGGAGRWMAR
jgi:hypothetical protein